jgi:hypothetical protein
MGSRVTIFALCAALAFAPLPALAGAMERACVRSDRSAANRSLCNCIQQVADFKLSKKDQRLAASFFKDPHKAQDIRQSDSRSHEAFWLRYKEFAAVAGASCGAAG